MRAVRVAHIDATHGIRGEVSAQILTDFPERFAALRTVQVGREAGGTTQRLEAWRLHKGKVLLKFEGFNALDTARSLVGADVWIDEASALELPSDVFYHADLIGLAVEDRTGRRLGVIRDILLTGGTDVLVVKTETGEILIPAARSICVEIDLEAGTVLIDPPAGLLEVNAG